MGRRMGVAIVVVAIVVAAAFVFSATYLNMGLYQAGSVLAQSLRRSPPKDGPMRRRLRQGLRKRGHVISRNGGALDADNIPPDVDFPALCREKLSAPRKASEKVS